MAWLWMLLLCVTFSCVSPSSYDSISGLMGIIMPDHDHLQTDIDTFSPARSERGLVEHDIDAFHRYLANLGRNVKMMNQGEKMWNTMLSNIGVPTPNMSEIISTDKTNSQENIISKDIL